eukprot:TRINITY_DN65066_c0_g1_i1.p1 TRINITY_DN65066_c0_g1~~TRINITY_DN65066_c0_g1_i1.p1  ORF type:complete len:608 (-),score=183.05 TRINITY_DN65066_c0_g1_i1:81-1904(-)
MAEAQAAPQGEPLQLIQLDVDAGKVQVNEDALGRLEKRLRQCGTKQVAVVSVMGAFRTGKSFLLDLFLRFLRYEEQQRLEGKEVDHGEAAERGEGSLEDYELPAWITSSGECIEGVSDDHAGGFRFKGGMDACTEGIWVWSEPFIRRVNGKEVALLLMDTQGAWDSNMTKEQSATIFGLTAVLSSKQIYNIHMQIQEDKVENLAYFMRFAQAALRKATDEMAQAGHKLSAAQEAEVEKPFQSLDFLVRDWRHFRDDFTIAQCKEQMAKHLSQHLDPKRVRENSTAEAMQNMFDRISCHCLPHPGLAIEKETWSGAVKDISKDFVRLMDVYAREVFTEGLDTKSILGSDLSTMSFPLVLRNFVSAFHDAAPVAMTFTQAMTSCTVLLAKEQAMKMYTKKMDAVLNNAPRGMDPQKFDEQNSSVAKEVEEEFKRITIFGSDDTRDDTWKAITENLEHLCARYREDNTRRLEKALVAFANIAVLGLALFVLDRASDWTCDWWSQTCTEMSKVMLVSYLGIFAYIGVHVYLLVSSRGRMAAAVAGGELWKEMVRIMGVYGDLISHVNVSELPAVAKKVFAGDLQGALADVRKHAGGAASSSNAPDESKKAK